MDGEIYHINNILWIIYKHVFIHSFNQIRWAEGPEPPSHQPVIVALADIALSLKPFQPKRTAAA
jgi:hypothetical protein